MEGLIQGKTCKVDLTITKLSKLTNTNTKTPQKGKSIRDDHDHDHDQTSKKKASTKTTGDENGTSSSSKTPYCCYGIMGSGSGFQFYGEYQPKGHNGHADHAHTEPLDCKFQFVPSDPTPTTKATAAAAAATAAAAASSYDDDDDVEQDVDEDVDFNEVIALHEDAGMSVEQLKKRYRSGESTTGTLKEAPATKKPREEESDDDDIGF
eukprot:CAMPEP_0202462292 /NCGR_PEP_ID=MMETSP1360-20130828/53387_1 /ASSEMBLY_ACC=CAM_ASM_000848 /TAXON_ID=515479 /ORGANISM="Licmophora paradoxa, Strain CCMP2313" /LENGTH=207 /DNA_ID=CAMNT_0049084705 /DNA_START=26 /DNA_END=649 /DNA_ORIENTATION=+